MSKVKVGYKNLLDDKAIFKEIEANALLTAAYKYAKSESDEIYKAVIDEKVALVLNDELIEVDKWKYIKVNDGDRIEIVSTLSGGKGKFLGFLMIAIGVAAIVFAPAIAPISLGTLGTINASSIVMFGISQVLSGMARLLFSSDLPNSQGATRETQTYSWSGIKTTARSDTRIPIIYGTCMTGGNVISAFTDVHNNDNYLNMLISLGEGEIEGICQEKDTSSTCSTSDQSDAAYKDPAIFIDDQPLRNYSDVEWWYRTGTNTEDASKDQYYPYAQNKIPYFDGAREQITDGREITSSWLTYTTSKEVDSVDIHIKTPALYDSSGGGSPNPSSVTIQLQFKETSGGSYHTYNFTRWTPHNVNQNGYLVKDYIDGGYIYGDVKPPTYYIKAVDLKYTTEISPEPEVPDITWVSEATFEVKDENDNVRYETVTFSYRGADATIPNVDPYVVHVTTSIHTWYTLYVYSTSTTTTKYQVYGLTKTGIVKTIHLDFNHIADAVGRAKYDIQIKRSSDATSDFTAANNIYFKNIIETVNGDFIYPNTALLGLRIKATNQLSGGLPNVKTLVKGVKVEVPAIEGLEDFDDLWYNDTLDRWETSNGTERTWDGITYTSNSIDENLVGYWALDENTGNIAYDSSGNDNDGTIYNSPSWVAGKSGYALDFDGASDQYIELNSPDDVMPGTNSMSVCGWVKGTWSGSNYDRFYDAFVINSQSSTQFFAGADNGTGKLRVRFSDGTNYAVTTFTDATWLDGSWHHVAVVYDRDAGKAYVYIDAVKSSTELDISAITLSIDTVTSFRFGIGGSLNNDLNGTLDELRVYNKALSQAEITELYNDPRGRSNEYSENSMLCVRNLLLNDRYGIGKYLTTSDLYNSGIVTALKSCHKKWYPTVIDYLSWYSSGVDWNSNWNFVVGSGSGDSSTQTISASNANTYSIEVKANAFISQSVEHDFKITLSSVTGNNVNIYLYGKDLSGTNILFGSVLDKGNGQHTITFTPTIHGIRSFIIKIENKDLASGNTENISFNITALELKNKSDSAEHLHTMNGVIDSKQSATTAIYEACDSFRCWPVWFKGKYNFVLNEDVTPVHNITAGNIKEFRESFTPLSEIPYKVEAQYLDKDLDYEMKSLVAKTTDSTIPKARENTVGMKWLTDRKRVERELKFRLNGLVNVSQSVNFKCGLDSIHATAGDVVNIQHPLPQWGSGGRLLSYNQASAFVVLDEAFTFDDVTASFLVKYQTAENSFMTATVDTSGLNNGDVEQKITLKSWPSTNPNDDSVYLIGKTSSIKPFRLIKVARNAENEVDVDAIEHISSIYSEPTLVVVRDNYSDLPQHTPDIRPNPPVSFSVTTTDVDAGIGFDFTVDVGDQNIKDTVIQMSTDPIVGYQTLLVIDSNQRTSRYVNNNLAIGTTYYFKAFCRTGTKSSNAIYTNVFINPNDYTPTAPTGIHIKGASPNSNTFNDVNVTIQWNSVGAVYNSPGPLSGYVVKVYHDAPINANLLRTAFVKSEEYTYTFDNNVSDSGIGTAYSTLVFILQSQTGNNISSEDSVPFKVVNSAPSTLGTVRATTSWNNVVFDWDKSTENDHKIYKCRTKVGNLNYSSWTEVDNNTYAYTLNATDVSTYSGSANVKIQVRDVDYFEQESTNNASVTGNVIVWADANDYTTINGDNIASYSITGSKIAVNAVAASQIYVDKLSALSANMGEITAGVITGANIRTSSSGKRAVMNSNGLRLETGATAYTYGDSAYKYGDSSRKYGSGVLGYVLHKSKGIPFYVNEEQTVADMHMYDRSSDPIATAERGDLCVVNGVLRICVSGGNPGNFATVGQQ